MKTKLSLLGTTLMAASASLILSNTEFAQMDGHDSKSYTPPPAGSPGASSGRNKPGTVLAGGVVVATQITREEAAKKYPPPNGKNYPYGDANYTFSHKPGYIRSPYSSTIYDCTGIPNGSFILDDHVNKVFIKP
jgi:hypothetical protein